MTRTKFILWWLQAIFYTFAGVMHFINPDFYMKIMPPILPFHLTLVYLSGLVEIWLGLMLVLPGYRNLAAWGIIALLIAIYPANIYAAMLAGTPDNPFPDVPTWAAYLRLPFQAVFIAWAWWFTGEEEF